MIMSTSIPINLRSELKIQKWWKTETDSQLCDRSNVKHPWNKNRNTHIERRAKAQQKKKARASSKIKFKSERKEVIKKLI